MFFSINSLLNAQEFIDGIILNSTHAKSFHITKSQHIEDKLELNGSLGIMALLRSEISNDKSVVYGLSYNQFSYQHGFNLRGIINIMNGDTFKYSNSYESKSYGFTIGYLSSIMDDNVMNIFGLINQMNYITSGNPVYSGTPDPAIIESGSISLRRYSLSAMWNLIYKLHLKSEVNFLIGMVLHVDILPVTNYLTQSKTRFGNFGVSMGMEF